MERIEEILNGVKTLGIGGHVRPYGDCVGSCMALYLYIRKYFPQIKADIYLESPKPVFHYISHIEDIKQSWLCRCESCGGRSQFSLRSALRASRS